MVAEIVHTVGKAYNATAWRIAELLVERVSGHIRRELGCWRMTAEEMDECARDLFAALWEALLDTGPAAEFWEVRFWVCLDRRLWNLAEKRQAASDAEVQVFDRRVGLKPKPLAETPRDNEEAMQIGSGDGASRNVLSPKESSRLYDVLAEPAQEPPVAMREAVERYQRLIRRRPISFS